MNKHNSFKVDFDIVNYKSILPDHREYQRDDEIINGREWQKGNIDNCYWKKYIPTREEEMSPSYQTREATRILKTGAWLAVKEEVLWLPPAYYFALQYGKVGQEDLEFRLKRLKHVYHKVAARLNPNCMGTLTIKNRADGETTMAMTDGLWECADGNMSVGQVGIQSKTRTDALNPCWSTVQITWQSLKQWVKDVLYPDFASGDNIEQKMAFRRNEDSAHGLSARNVLIQYYPCVYNAMDGKHNMKKCILDEVCKWLEAEFYDTFINYSKFIMPGFQRRGILDMFSSPADTVNKSNEQVYHLYKNSDPAEMQENGTTKSRIHRYFSNPLDGIQGAYDKFGDADPERIYDKIMQDRKNVPKDKLMGEVRAYPLNEAEAFESADGGAVWTNIEGIRKRSIYLIGHKFKNEITKEPINIYGSLERIDGYIDGDVDFRPADVAQFDEKNKFCFSYLPKNKEPLKNVKKPPQYVERCLGLDPTANRYEAKNVVRQSKAAMVVRQFRDLFRVISNQTLNVPVMYYNWRPTHQEVIWEDCLKAAIFNRALIQYENRSDKFENYAEDRGYSDWLLPSIGAAAGSRRKGDAPSGGKNAFLLEGIGLIDANTNIPLNLGDPYNLEYFWFYEQLVDLIGFNPLDTHKSDITMADIQSLIGIVKILYKKMKPSMLNDVFIAEALGYY